jgi:hypothetical protein
MKYIYHHLGLGDHIICNGLVRSLINPNEEYKMFVKSHNLDSVSFMYRDLNNLSLLVKEKNPANLEKIYNLYNQLHNRQDRIRGVLPLMLLKENRNAIFPFNDYSNDHF